MKYTCKLIIRNEIGDIVPRFAVELKYKQEGKLFYKSVNVFYLSVFNMEDNQNYQDELLGYIRGMNSKSESEWLDIVCDAIREEEGEELREGIRYESLKKEIKTLEQMTKKFEVIV